MLAGRPAEAGHEVAPAPVCFFALGGVNDSAAVAARGLHVQALVVVVVALAAGAAHGCVRVQRGAQGRRAAGACSAAAAGFAEGGDRRRARLPPTRHIFCERRELLEVCRGRGVHEDAAGRQHVARVQGLDRFCEAPVLGFRRIWPRCSRRLSWTFATKSKDEVCASHSARCSLPVIDVVHPRVVLVCLAVRSQLSEPWRAITRALV